VGDTIHDGIGQNTVEQFLFHKYVRAQNHLVGNLLLQGRLLIAS